MKTRNKAPFPTVQCSNPDCVSPWHDTGTVPKSVADRQTYNVGPLCTVCADHYQREGELPETQDEFYEKQREHHNSREW